MSLCGHLIENAKEDDLFEIFKSQEITYEEFSHNPLAILSSKDLLIKVDDNLYEP